MAYPGMCYARAVEWLSRTATYDSLQVDTDDDQAVTNCLASMGVPPGWLEMFGHRNIDDLIVQACQDGWLPAQRNELEWLSWCLQHLQAFTHAGTPWGVAAWHVLLGLTRERYGDGTMILWVSDE